MFEKEEEDSLNVRQIYENADDYYEREHETLEALLDISDWKELITTIYKDGEYSGYIRGAMERL